MKANEIIKSYLRWLSGIGSNEEDEDEIRIAKTIWSVCLGFAIPLSYFSAVIFAVLGLMQLALFMFTIAFYWSVQVMVLSRWKCGIEMHGLFSQAILIIGSFVMTILLGGLMQSGGVFFFGMMAPVYALAFPKIKRAWFMLGLYFVLTIISALLDPVIQSKGGLNSTMNLVLFVYHFFICVIFFFIALYFFVVQRSKTLKLLTVEQERSENLLLNILPKDIASILKKEERVIADQFPEASILFADVVGFTPMSAVLTPVEVVKLLNEVFSYFDTLVDKYGVEKIKTIGDCYMVAAGVPKSITGHAHALVNMALDMREYVRHHTFGDDRRINFRIGINSGPVVAGVIGRKKFIYDLWGDAVNTASRMESHGHAGIIQITQNTYDLIKDDFECIARGEIDIKGKGEMAVYHVEGRPPFST